MYKSFPFFRQLDVMDCGPTCLRMIAKFYGRSFTNDFLREKTQIGKEGVTLLGIADAAESIGLKSLGLKISFEQLLSDIPFPAILYWQPKHFVVILPHSRRQRAKKHLRIADPRNGIIKLTKEEFLRNWISTTEQGVNKGVALVLEPTPEFYESEYDTEDKKAKIGWSTLLGYIKDFRLYFIQILLGSLLGALLQLVFPYLTQSIVDTGINTQNLSFIQIILAAQLMLLFSQTVVEFIRSRILLHISTRINISLLSFFWAKLLKLPMKFFDSKHPGDIIQRISDHHRIEEFLTGTAISSLFSIITLILYSFVLYFYDITVFFIFLTGSVLYLLWIRLFLKYRRKLDYKRFSIASKENNATMQLVYGMQEIKLNNAENTYRWAWEGLQAGLFKLKFKNLSLDQYQEVGAFFINQSKNILITYLVAKLVIEGNLTMGVMLAIQYILGQLSSPIEQLIIFTQQAQNAKISLERLNDIHSLEDEEPISKFFDRTSELNDSISMKNLSFTYPGAGNEPVLKNINLTIPKGKVTAIVGMSGCGKTTLIKLLLRFYDSYSGEIQIGTTNYNTVSPKYWRSMCGSVMQESFIFNDNIRKNITVTDNVVDSKRLQEACRIANIDEFIESLPLGFYTKLGAEGKGISGGQKQRITIARAVYKNPKYIFLDEATNSLDANNEKEILENLQQFFQGKTVVVVAHRLSTVKNADNIIVLDKGEIVEKGTHTELTSKRGMYYQLVKNQLELGN
ncbi:ABC transporter ATP-binding protein [Labilibaculum manganireducens]|uniref:ABC transporter ATP-binding protein n=1 Tax=Labilibaculum manganireducens TaxID=1940525 RepID=A0A2N3HSY0_9BACT|nr:peptidase domain-containing ABC transporter [Labilibaculum manganireducens]PKQ61165.1 ABC transporter ATP-binding protein [Labilibaculum manganireducens]